jgi:hypothetical protein
MTRKFLTTVAALLTMGSIADAGPGCDPVKAHYDALKVGMTLEQANIIVGCEAEEMTRAGDGRYEMITYVYQQSPLSGSIIMVFGNGKMMSKMQMMLGK